MRTALADIQRDLDRLRERLEDLAHDFGITIEDLRQLAEKETS